MRNLYLKKRVQKEQPIKREAEINEPKRRVDPLRL